MDSAPRRKRGGQPGNHNRFRHGRYTRHRAARRASARALMRRARDLIIRIGMIAKSRAALRKKQMAVTFHRPTEGIVKVKNITSVQNVCTADLPRLRGEHHRSRGGGRRVLSAPADKFGDLRDMQCGPGAQRMTANRAFARNALITVSGPAKFSHTCELGSKHGRETFPANRR
jgi:hypothetical protein